MALQTAKKRRITIKAPLLEPINLGVHWIPQALSNWCWAACADMVLDHFHMPSVRQCELASAAFENVACCRNPQGCNQGLDDARITALWHRFGFITARRITNRPSCQELQVEISSRRPVEFGFSYSSRKGHVIIALGWGMNKLGVYFLINDPDPRARTTRAIYYSALLDLSHSGVWDATWLGLRR